MHERLSMGMSLKKNGTRLWPERARPLEFLRGFLQNPRGVASVVPSSPILVEHLIERGDVARARVIVELGPGTGVVTRGLLQNMPADGKLIAVELHPEFARLLRETFDDPRLTVFEGNARDLERALAAAGVRRADLVVSGIPFSTMDRRESRRILEATRKVLNPNGRFVAYQFRDHVRRLAEPIFGPPRVSGVLRNIPPVRVYTWSRASQT